MPSWETVVRTLRAVVTSPVAIRNGSLSGTSTGWYENCIGSPSFVIGSDSGGGLRLPDALAGEFLKARFEQEGRAAVERVDRGQARLLGDGLGVLVDVLGVLAVDRDPDDLAGAEALDEVDLFLDRGDLVVRVLEHRPLLAHGVVLEDDGVRRAAVEDREADAGVGGVHDRGLPVDEDDLAALGGDVAHHLLDLPGAEVRGHAVDDGARVGSEHAAGLAGRDEAGVD